MINDVFKPVQTTPYSIGYKIKSRIWNLVNISIFRWSLFYMRKYRIALLRLFGAKIDWTSSIDRLVTIIDPWNLEVGKYSSIGEYACIRCRGKVKIGEKCCIGRGVYLLSASHNIESKYFELITAPIVIMDNVWIATNSIIGKGITISEGAVVAAGSVVVKNVDSWTVVGGNPAKPIKSRVIKN